MIPCKQQTCEQIYVGHSQNIPGRIDQHRTAVEGRSFYKSAVARHRHTGRREMDPDNHVVPYRSDSKRRRLMIETPFITLCNTVANTKASSNTTDMDVLGPILLGASNINWKAVQRVQPNFNPLHVPKRARKLFRNQSIIPQNDVLISDDPRFLTHKKLFYRHQATILDLEVPKTHSPKLYLNC